MGFPPPAGTGEGKAPQDGLSFVEQKDLTPARPGRQRGEVDRGLSKVSGGRLEPSGGTTGASGLFF